MQLDAADVITVVIAVAVSAGAATTLLATNRTATDFNRRTWLAAGTLALVLLALGALDVYTRTPREVEPSTIVLGAILPLLGAVGMLRATRRVRPWIRWIFLFLTTFVLLFVSLLLGASYVSRFLGF